MNSVLLIDDHPLVNYGLALCLEETGRFIVCGKAASLNEARCFIEKTEYMPSLIILDIMLGEENGLDFLSFLKNFCREKKIPKPPVLVCSMIEDPFRIRTALSQEVAGFISKAAGKEELFKAIDTVLEGKVYVSGGHENLLRESSPIHARFTKKEQMVLHLMKQNLTNQEIAKKLGLSLRTVENHISNMYFKTGYKNRLDLIKI